MTPPIVLRISSSETAKRGRNVFNREAAAERERGERSDGII